MRHAIAAVLAVSLLACGPGTEEDTDKKKPGERTLIKVTGYAAYHPAELAWRAANDKADPPALAGATVNVEDALSATLNKPPLKSTTLGADLKFSVSDVDVTDTHLALVGVVKGVEGLTQSGFGLLRGHPTEDLLDMPLYVVSDEFVDVLAAAIGYERADFNARGVIVGQAVDADLKGVAGTKLALLTPSAKVLVDYDPADDNSESLWYLKEDLSGFQAGGTSANGLFLFTPKTTGASDYTVVKDEATFRPHLSGARKNTVTSVFFEQE